MKNIYFSEKFTDINKKNIKLLFSKKITKNEKIFLKLLFFKIISNSSFLDNAEIRLDEINATPEFSSITDYASFFKNLTEKRIFFTVSLSDNEYSGSFGLISSFLLTSDYCKIFFAEEFKYCFSNEKNFFSLLEIDKFIFMGDSFSFNLYNNIIKIGKDKKEISLPVSSLKIYLNSDDKYKRFFDFEKHILKKAVLDINTFTEFNIEYKKIKDGARLTNKITEITFLVKKSEKIYTPYDDTIYKTVELIKEYVEKPEEIYRLLVMYVAKRGYKYVQNNIDYLKNYSFGNFERNLKKALLLDWAYNNLKLYIDINRTVKSPIVLFYTLTRKINEIKRHYPEIESLLQDFELKNIHSISYFNDKDYFEFINGEIGIYVKYYSDKKSIIRIYLPENIIEKINSSKQETD